MTALAPEQQAAVQRRTVMVLSAGQVLGGIAFGATVSLGALLAADLSGDDGLSGLATASVTLGPALCSIPLARMAARVGLASRVKSARAKGTLLADDSCCASERLEEPSST